jgi:hypothetical protein
MLGHHPGYSLVIYRPAFALQVTSDPTVAVARQALAQRSDGSQYPWFVGA